MPIIRTKYANIHHFSNLEASFERKGIWGLSKSQTKPATAQNHI